MTTTVFFDTPLRVVLVSRFRPALSGLSLSLCVSGKSSNTLHDVFLQPVRPSPTNHPLGPRRP
jgi:hypothetical protein